MQPRYTTRSINSYEEYRKFHFAIYNHINHVPIKMGIFCLILIALGILGKDWVSLLLAVLSPSLFTGLCTHALQKAYNKDALSKNLGSTFAFFDDHFLWVNKITERKIFYNEIKRVIETKTNLYIMTEKENGYILVKSECSDELMNFVRSLKTSK